MLQIDPLKGRSETVELVAWELSTNSELPTYGTDLLLPCHHKTRTEYQLKNTHISSGGGEWRRTKVLTLFNSFLKEA